LKIEAQKLDGLEFLKNQIPPGSFTNANEVSKFMDEGHESKMKNERLYRQVRFQRNSTSLKKNGEMFRLKIHYLNLATSDYAANLCQYLDWSGNATN